MRMTETLTPTGWLTLCRRDAGGRVLEERRVRNSIVSSGRDLAAVGQDSWLTKCDSKDYGFTRRWGHEIRKWAPWAKGLAWRSRLEEASLAYVFFEDRCAGSFKEILDPILEPDRNRLDREPGASYLRHWLAAYNVTVFR